MKKKKNTPTDHLVNKKCSHFVFSFLNYLMQMLCNTVWSNLTLSLSTTMQRSIGSTKHP